MEKRGIGVALLVVASASAAWACGVCASAMADLDLPPIQAWALLGGAWFFATAFFSQIFRAPLPLFPRLPWALGILVALFIFSGIASGLGVFVLLMPWAAIPFFLSLVLRRPPFDNRPLRTWLIVAGLAALAGVAILAFVSHRIRTTRTRAEFIVQWSYTPPSREYLKELKEEEPGSLDEYRYILEYGNDLLVSDVAERIAALGNPEVDIPLLEARLEEFRGDSYRDSCVDNIQAAIEKLREQVGQPEGSMVGP